MSLVSSASRGAEEVILVVSRQGERERDEKGKRKVTGMLVRWCLVSIS